MNAREDSIGLESIVEQFASWVKSVTERFREMTEAKDVQRLEQELRDGGHIIL